MNWDVEIDIYTLSILCIRYITNENLLYITSNLMLYGDLKGEEI